MKPSNREPTFVEMLFQEAMLDIEARTSPIPKRESREPRRLPGQGTTPTVMESDPDDSRACH
jgi:hypothetical protein